MRWIGLVAVAALSAGCGENAEAPAAQHVGIVDLHHFRIGDSFHSQALVRFSTVTPSSDQVCTSFTDGACTATRCEGGDNAPPVLASAGLVTVTAAEFTSSFAPNGRGFYSGSLGSNELFILGERISVEANGATVPSFQGTFLAPPENVALRPVTFEDTRTVVTSDGLSFEWEADAARGSEVFVVSFWSADPFLDSDFGPDSSVAFDCEFPLGDMRAAIPARILAAVRGFGGPLSVATRTQTTHPVGQWEVLLRARQDLWWLGTRFE